MHNTIINNILSEEKIKRFLNKEYKKTLVYVFDSIDSTNNYAKKAAEQTQSNMLITANSQTAGRGRFGRKFFSPKDTGIYMSIVLKKELNIEDTFLLTFAAAIAVCKATEKLTKIKPAIKWINDIFINNLKICGILTETVTDLKTKLIKHSITGIGLNVNTKNFPNELNNTATSLFCNISRNKIIAEITNYFFNLTEKLKKDEIFAEYKKRSNTINRNISYTENGTTKYGKAVDINENGNLIIKDNNSNISVLKYDDIYICENIKYKVLP